MSRERQGLASAHLYMNRMAAINYMSDATYYDAVRNPSSPGRSLGMSPDRGLKQLYKNNAVKPIEIAQVLSAAGYTTVAVYAVSLGDTDAEARNFLTRITV